MKIKTLTILVLFYSTNTDAMFRRIIQSLRSQPTTRSVNNILFSPPEHPEYIMRAKKAAERRQQRLLAEATALTNNQTLNLTPLTPAKIEPTIKQSLNPEVQEWLKREHEKLVAQNTSQENKNHKPCEISIKSVGYIHALKLILDYVKTNINNPKQARRVKLVHCLPYNRNYLTLNLIGPFKNLHCTHLNEIINNKLIRIILHANIDINISYAMNFITKDGTVYVIEKEFNFFEHAYQVTITETFTKGHQLNFNCPKSH